MGAMNALSGHLVAKFLLREIPAPLTLDYRPIVDLSRGHDVSAGDTQR